MADLNIWKISFSSRSLFWQLYNDHIPTGFLKSDLRTSDEGRILIFATDDQLELLAAAKQWFADGTFKLSRRPFYQLYSLHAFIVNQQGMKQQIPLVYLLMSGKIKIQYSEAGLHNLIWYVMAAPLQTDCLIRTSILIGRNIPYNNCCNDNPLNYGIIFYTSLFQALLLRQTLNEVN